MPKSEKAGLIVNRILSFLVGGLLVFAVMSFTVVNTLKTENVELTKALDVSMFEATKLLSAARDQFNGKEYSKAKASLATLLEKHPGSAEAIEGRVLLASIETALMEADARWEAAMPEIQEQWAADFAEGLRTKSDTAREQLEKDMVDTIIREWEKAKVKIRSDWEMQS